jgi:hypothetical protein
MLEQIPVNPLAAKAVDVAELFADGKASVTDLGVARVTDGVVRPYANSAAEYTCSNAAELEEGTDKADAVAGNAAWAMSHPGDIVPDDDSIGQTRFTAVEAIQADIIRDIFGNPFRPVKLAAIYQTPIVVALAQAAYDEKQLPRDELNLLRLAVLADALEEVGAPGELVTHLRSPGPHVRGCFAVDLCLGLS